MSKKKHYRITITGVGQTRANHTAIRKMFYDELDTTFSRCIFEGAEDHPYGVSRSIEDDTPYEMNVPYEWFAHAVIDMGQLFTYLKDNNKFANVSYQKHRSERKIAFTYENVEYTAELISYENV